MSDADKAVPVSLVRHGRIGLLCIDHPPVNALSVATVAGLDARVAAFEADPSLDGLLIWCAGRTFVAGGDIAQFDAPDFTAAPYNRILARIEASERLVVAALHGTALGGGLELALACHYRVALPGTRVGLPEIKLGLLPGSLGTQRLPRACGAALALELMLSGRMLDAEAALAAGIVDALVQGEPLAAGLNFLEDLLERLAPPRRLSTLSVPVAGLPKDFFAQAMQHATQQRAHYPAAAAIVQAVEAAATLPFAQGEAMEAALLTACVASPESRALRHLFFAERQAARVPGMPAGAAPRALHTAGVIGAGTMGSRIAMSLADAGLPVTLVEASGTALARGLASVRAQYEASAAAGRIQPEQVARRMGLIAGTLDYAALAGCELVIEAVDEDMALKQHVCARLGRICKPGAIIATNTSTLDVEVLAEASGRPADFAGVHFRNPANGGRLIEVVRGSATAPDVVVTAMQLARRLGKVAVVSGVCFGFIGNRMAEAYLRESEFLLMEGVSPARLDAVMQAYGMAMGPCRMLDLAGIDVGAKIVLEYGKAGGLPPDPAYRAVVRTLFMLGRLGCKSGAGYYRYPDGQPVPDPEAERICAALGRAHGIARRMDIADAEIVERLLYPLINEAAKLLEEGVACRPGDIDMVWTAGYGFPDYLGGPVWQADSIGLPRIVAGLEHYARLRGNPYDYWDISPLLAALARGGQRLSGWSAPPAAADAPATAEQGRPAMPISLSPDPLAGQSRIQSGPKPPQSVH
ncbi:3-hydroxyacyl-CoA dehydrogenase NAD-binding domain-containing protein [Cupriavidus basilensis]|uniref:3-hydroxyacyl-CoA dehydrogenase NAD-binding domain-containing protein n=1 Tax=Cupriavidus basilensis TaxID=68895 RepID=UPI0023E7839C|nr:3-hydroxyacyl-CoA dehydrogenase NAD-binding domain-containing protein [Cupriavidus basilensis]MDF3881156.1 3-hydroxyacyl-CoA dehydrogenase NAD-binding domain-containing protein [Cupriavidus basilensis]